MHPAHTTRKNCCPVTTCAPIFTTPAARSTLPDCFKRFKCRKLLTASCRCFTVLSDSTPLCILHFLTSLYVLPNIAACFARCSAGRRHKFGFDLASILRPRSIPQAKIGLPQHFWSQNLSALNVTSAVQLTTPSHRLTCCSLKNLSDSIGTARPSVTCFTK